MSVVELFDLREGGNFTVRYRASRVAIAILVGMGGAIWLVDGVSMGGRVGTSIVVIVCGLLAYLVGRCVRGHMHG
jgi:hypothetical protein